MSTAAEVLIDLYCRLRGTSDRVLAGLSEEELTARLDPDANTIAWLFWHLTRVQDDHVADVAGTEQVWTSAGFADRFGLPFAVGATGYGHSSEEVAQVRGVSSGLLSEYLGAVLDTSTSYLSGLQDDDLDRIVDTRWDPAVTLGVRLASVATDNLQHCGQAAFIRGVLKRR
jgi:hypothetical protein